MKPLAESYLVAGIVLALMATLAKWADVHTLIPVTLATVSLASFIKAIATP